MAATRSPWQLFSRICASTLGSYAFCWGFVALGGAVLIATGTEFHEASSLVLMLAFPMFLTTFCWAFIASSLVLVWGVLAWGGALMALAGWWIARLVG